MTSTDPVAALFARDHFGIKLGLDNIHALCDALGHPERCAPTVIVAGTNGKGSVAAFVSSALSAAGYHVGRYTSPHLVRIEERFALDGTPVATDTLAEALGRVFLAEQACRDDGRLPVPATFFELTTAAAFEVFRRAAVDVMVLEVGLGGRFDATNVTNPVAGAITTIDLDHTAHLGSTIAQIAFEKAGVIKPGMTVVVGERKPEATSVIAAVSRERAAEVVGALAGSEVAVDMHDERTWVTLTTPARAYGPMSLALGGRHQAQNALVAVRLLEALEARHWAIGAEAIAHGVANASWPGRLQTVQLSNGKRLLLDAAHNAAGAAALAAYVGEAWPGRPPLVFAAMRDKDTAAMLAAMAPVVGRFVFTAPAMPRALRPGELLDQLRGLGIHHEAATSDTPGAAIELALLGSPRAVVAGSIFLLGEILPIVA
jgi:dihydrofolate synthase/folylpolyglutamate synthase